MAKLLPLEMENITKRNMADYEFSLERYNVQLLWTHLTQRIVKNAGKEFNKKISITVDANQYRALDRLLRAHNIYNPIKFPYEYTLSQDLYTQAVPQILAMSPPL